MVERLLSTREVKGSMPLSSIGQPRGGESARTISIYLQAQLRDNEKKRHNSVHCRDTEQRHNSVTSRRKNTIPCSGLRTAAGGQPATSPKTQLCVWARQKTQFCAHYRERHNSVTHSEKRHNSVFISLSRWLSGTTTSIAILEGEIT